MYKLDVCYYGSFGFDEGNRDDILNDTVRCHLSVILRRQVLAKDVFSLSCHGGGQTFDGRMYCSGGV